LFDNGFLISLYVVDGFAPIKSFVGANFSFANISQFNFFSQNFISCIVIVYLNHFLAKCNALSPLNTSSSLALMNSSKSLIQLTLSELSALTQYRFLNFHSIFREGQGLYLDVKTVNIVLLKIKS